jgi:hypothetical protein
MRYSIRSEFDLGDQYIGLDLHESAGTVSGHGFYSFTPGFASTVTGTFDGEQFILEMRARYHGETDVRVLRGRLRGDTLDATIEIRNVPNSSFPFQLWRTSVTPVGSYEAVYSGAVTGARSGEASFIQNHFAPETRVFLSLGANQSGPTFIWKRSAHPEAGHYELGGDNPSGVLELVLTPGAPATTFDIVSGTLDIDTATRYALIGRFDFTARERNPVTTPATTRATGTFSAGCNGDYC